MDLNRRKFLKGSALAASAFALPTIVPATVFGANAPSNRINMALIGCGSRSGSLLKSFCQFADVRVIAAVDPIKAARDARAKFVNNIHGANTCKAYEDYREVLQDKNIDGVIIATPDHWHVPIAIAAARAGKDMYVEKPLGISMEWAKILREECAKNKVIFQYGTQQRSSAAARKAMNLVHNGYIGEIERVDMWAPSLNAATVANQSTGTVPAGINYDLYVGPAKMRTYAPARISRQGSWYSHDFAIGFIAGWGAHPLDIAQWGLNMDHTSPVLYEGSGVGAPKEDKIWNTTREWDVQCTYANGLKARFMDAKTAQPIVKEYHRAFKTNGTTFHGSEGWVSFSRGATYMSRGGKWESNTMKIQMKPSDSKVYVSDNHARNLIDCMKSRKATISPLEAGIRGDAISHLSDIVVRTGKSVKWDPKKELIINGTPEQIKLTDRAMRKPYTI